MRTIPALALACALMVCAPASAAELALDGVAVGTTIPVVVAAHGLPGSVAAAESGNRFDWTGADGTLRCVTDDDARVRAVDWMPAGTPSMTVEIDGKRTPPLRFGTFTPSLADSQIASPSEYATATMRSYRIAPQRMLVLYFDRAGTLSRAVYGEELILIRAGILPADTRTPPFPFKPPQARSTARVGTGTRGAIVRVDLDRKGAVQSTSILVPSGDPAFDKTVLQNAEGDRYVGATLSGRGIGSTLYREYWE
jgi:TonB family protein